MRICSQLGGAVAETIEQLSRVAVLLDLVAVEETQNEPDPLADYFRRLHDHPGHGIYNVLCRLHGFWAAIVGHDQLMATLDRLVDVASLLTLTETRQPSHRHLRSFAILRDLGELLSRSTARLDEFIVVAMRTE